MADINVLATNFGKFIAERDELHVDEINDSVIESAVQEFVRQVLKNREVTENQLMEIHVAIEHGLIDGATVNEMEG